MGQEYLLAPGAATRIDVTKALIRNEEDTVVVVRQQAAKCSRRSSTETLAFRYWHWAVDLKLSECSASSRMPWQLVHFEALAWCSCLYFAMCFLRSVYSSHGRKQSLSRTFNCSSAFASLPTCR
jgi:hypothetical protein